MLRRLAPLVLAAAAACSTEVTPVNPYDPATPLPLQAKARVGGTVETGAGAPFTGLQIYLRQNGQLIDDFTTDANGAFVFTALVPGTYTVEAQAAGFAPLAIPLVLAPGADIDVGALSLAPLGGVDTGFLRGSALLGKVAALPGAPAEPDPAADNGGILVEAVGTPYAAVTTSTGEYSLALPPGTHSLRVSKPNYVAQTVDDQVVTLGVVSPVVVVVLATNPAKVTGQVVAELPGGGVGPLADALVTLDGTSATGLTNAAGQFTLDQLAPGSYLLRVLKAGYDTVSAPVLNLEGGEERLLPDPLSLALQRGALRGRVALADAADASGVVVEVTGSGRAVVTGADGTWAFDALVAGTYEVRARRDGYAQQVVGGLAVTSGAALDVPVMTLTRQGGTVAITQGAVTRDRAVTLQLGAPAAAAFRASEDPTFQDPLLGDTTGSRPYRGPGTSEPFTLSDREGEHVVHVVFLDGSGGASTPASAAIVLDRVAPTAPSVIVNGEAAFTRSDVVGLTLSAQDLAPAAGVAVSGLARMELADNAGFAGAVLVEYNLAHTWRLSGADGLKSIYARFYDRAGNRSAEAVALVTLDRLAPEAAAIAVSGGAGLPAGTTASPLVTVSLSAFDANEGTDKRDLQVRLSNVDGFAGATWQPYAPTVSWLVPPGDGPKTVYAQFMDPAGNQGLVVHADVTLVGTAPSDGRITVAGGAAATRELSVPVALGATGAASMRLSVNGVPQAAGWIPYADSATVDLSAVPDETTATVSVAFRNAAGVEGAVASATIVCDRRAPTAPSVAVQGGAASTRQVAVTLVLGATDAPAAPGGYASGLDAVELSADPAFAAPTVLPFAATAPWTLTGGEGRKEIWARFRDRAGNRSGAVMAEVILDQTPPGSPVIVLAGGAAATGAPVVAVALSAADANDGGPGQPLLQVRLSESSGFAGATWQPMAAAATWTFSGADGPRTLHAQFRDAAGNESAVASDGITLAATPPAGGAILLAGGATATQGGASVPVALSATGAAQMRLSVNGVPQAAGWIPYAAAAAVDLSGAPDEATATVTVSFRNAGGLEGGSASASILVDRRAPTGGAVTINGGADFTRPLAVTLALSALEAAQAPGGVASGLASVELSNDGFATSTTVSMVSTLSWTLASGPDGDRTVSARFRDRAGNVTGTVTDTIRVDTTEPGNPAITLSGGAAAQPGYTGSPVVTAALAASDANGGGPGLPNLEMRLSSDSGFAGAAWQPYAPSISFALPGADGPKTVWAQFRDAAGNVSAAASASITLLVTPPSSGSIAVAAATTSPTTAATISASGADRMLISVNGVPQPAGWIPYATTATVDLGPNPDEATRGISVLFRNAGGVEGAAAATSIVVDRTPPTVTAGSLKVNGGAAYTGAAAVTVSLAAGDGPFSGTAASGVAWVELSNDGTSFTQLPFAASVPWTLSAPGPDGARTVHARVRDRAGNASAATATASIYLDRTGPTPSAPSIAGNATAKAGYTGTPVVAVTVGASDVSEGASKADLQVRLGNDSNFSGSTWQPYTTQLQWVLPVGDGPKDVWVQFKDGVGNLSTPTFATINLMETPPSAGNIAVAGGAAFTRLTSVPAVLSAVNADRMLIYVNGQPQAAGWVPYDVGATVALGADPDESVRTVSVVFRNAGGVDGGDALTSVVMDRSAPSTGTVLVDGGATFTGDLDVVLTLASSDGPSATGTMASGLDTVELSNDGFVTFQSRPYAASVAWRLAESQPDGDRTVSARFRDKAGNVSAVSATDAITLDTIPPAAAPMTLAGNATARAGFTGTPVVTATVSATDANQGGAARPNLQVRLGHDATFAGSAWQSYASQLSWVLQLGDGPKQVWVQFRDAVGNQSAPASASIQLLEAPPSAGAVAVAGGAAATNQALVSAAVQATNADRVLLYVDGRPQAAGWVDLPGPVSLDLGAAPDEATRTVTAVFRSAGGVDGADALTSIVFDQRPPVGNRLLIAGGAAFTGSLNVDLSLSAGDGPSTGAVASGVDTVELSNDGFATFESRAYAGTVAWTLASGAGGQRTVSARFRDRAGNVSGTPWLVDDVTYDRSAPTSPTITLAGNATAEPGYTGTAVVTASLSAVDENAGAAGENLEVRVANDATFVGAGWQPYVPTMSWVLEAGDGPKQVWAQFRDAAGNESGVSSASIQLLTAPPSGGSIVLDGGRVATSSATTSANVSATGAFTKQFSVNGQAVTGWIPYATNPVAVSLATVTDQTTATVSVSFRNRGGVEGGGASAAIRYDRTAPEAGLLGIVGTLGNGTPSPDYTTTPAVLLQVTPPGADEVEMAVAQAPTATTLCSSVFGLPLWQPVSRNASLVLTGSDGAKRVCVLFRDAAGNFSAAKAAPASITLDTTAPSNPSFVNMVSTTQNGVVVPGGSAPVVTASNDAGSGGVTYQCTGGTGTNYGPGWVDCGTTTTLTKQYLVATNGQSTLGVRARDAAYNFSPGSFVQIIHDDVAPFPPFITDIRSSRDSVTVTWDSSGDADVVDFLVHYGGAPGALTGTGAAQGPSPVSVGVVNGQLTQSFTLTGLTQGLPYYVAIEAVDAAGNRSGKGGERSAVPAKANPRVLSTFAGEPRALGMRATATKTFLYFAENQGVVQFDASADNLTVPTGRVYLPDVVPDEAASLPVFDCNRSGTLGHCLVVSGTTAEGDYRNNHAAYRAPAHVVFFPLDGTQTTPRVGSIEAVLPVRPLRTAVATVAGEPVIFAFHATGMQAYTFKSGKLSFLKKVVDEDPGLSFSAVHAAEFDAPTNRLWVFSTSPDWGPAPFLYSYDVGSVLAGLVGYSEYGSLFDQYGGLVGDAGARFAIDLKGGQYAAITDPFTDTVVAYRYGRGGLIPNATIALPSGSASDGTEPIGMTGGIGGHHYVFVSSGMGNPEFYEVLDSGSFSYLSTTILQNDAVMAVAGASHAGAERVMVLEGGPGNRFGERFAVAGAVVTHQAGADFSEVQTDAFAEIDRFLYFANGSTIRIADAANPFSPQLVKVHTPGWATAYWKVVAHGRYLYALSSGRLDIYRANPDGSLTYRAGFGLPPSAISVVGRWLFISTGTTIYAYSTANLAAGTLTFLTTLSTPGFTITGMDARFRNATPGVAQGGAGAPVPQAVLYATSLTELRTFAFDGATLSALGGPVAVPVFGADGVTVRGDYAIVNTPSGSYRELVSNPASLPAIPTTLFPVSGATLLQGGYVVGLGQQGDPNGPIFSGLSSAAVDGAIRYSVCAGSNMGGSAPSSLTHADGRYAASCGRNGVTLFTPVAVDGGRLLKSSDITPSWNTTPVAPLASDGMVNRLGGPTVPCSGCTDHSRLYSSSEQFAAEGSPGTPSYATGNNLSGNPPNLAFTTDVLRYPAFMTQVDGALYVVTGRGFSAPTVDAFDVGTSPWTYMGRYTFTGTAQASAIVTDGEYLYVARNSPGTVEVLDIRNPVSISLRATIAASGGLDIGALAVARDRLYVGMRGTNAVRVYDVSAVQATGTILARTSVSLGYVGDVTGVAVVGGTLFATQAVSNDPAAPFKLYTYGLSAVERDGLGASWIGLDTSVSPLRSPVVAGDVLYVASNQGTASWDLTGYWRSRSAPVAKGGVNLADPFSSAPVTLRIDGPFASLVGGVYRVFDLR